MMISLRLFTFLLILHFAAIVADSTSDKELHRRILHQPLFPESSLPPPVPPSAQTPPATPDQPFFHEIPSGQSSPDQSQNNTPTSTNSNAAVPIPTATQPQRPIKKVAIAISVGIVTLGMLSTLAFFLYRHRARNPSEEQKLVGEGGLARGAAADESRAAPPSSFLYIGTVEPSGASMNGNAGEAAPASKSPYRKLDSIKRSDRYRPSPELQPLPPLAKPPLQPPPMSENSSDDEESRDTAFHSPQCSSVSYDESYYYTPVSRQNADGNGNGNGIGVMAVPHSKRTSPKSRFSGHSTKIAHSHTPPAPPEVILAPKFTGPPPLVKNLARIQSAKNSPPSHMARISVPPPPPPLPPLPPPPPPPPPAPGLVLPSKPTSAITPRPNGASPARKTWASVPKTVLEFGNVKSETEAECGVDEDKAKDKEEGFDAVAGDSGGAKPKLKPLHWDKVRATSDRATVWDQLKASSFQLNEDMMESLFGANSAPKENSVTRRSVLPPIEQENRVLDPKKSQNIAILLRALNVTRDEVTEALLDGNPEGLGPELLETLVKMAPTKEEEIKLRDYEGDPTKLGSAERFLKAVLGIPFAFKRVEAMLYRANFDTEVKYLLKSFETLEEASEELKNSRLFLKLLEAVLRTGNRMNVGTNRGDAKSFKLETLLKLVDIKGTDGKTTLLHFVVQEIIRSEGDSKIENQASTRMKEDDFRKQGLQVVAGLSRDLGNVKKAAGMDSDVLAIYVTKLESGLERVGLVMAHETRPESTLNNNGKFFDSMRAFLREAGEEITGVKAYERKALSLVKEVTEYFHGDTVKEVAHPLRIFVIVRDFLAILDQVCKEVGRMQDRTVVGSARSFRISATASLPVLNRYNVRRDDSSSDDDDESLSP